MKSKIRKLPACLEDQFSRELKLIRAFVFSMGKTTK